jgi:choline dehydrogenase
MRRYFQRIENCQYVRKPADPELDPARHGFGGWLSTNTANPKLVLRDAKLLRAVLRAVWGAAKTAIATRDLGRLRKLKRNFDPNDWRTVADGIEGICVTPMSTQRGKRHAVREYIRSVQNTCSNQLVIKTHALVTKVVFDDHNTASGVEFLEGAHLYGADPNASANIDSAVKKTINAKREVILSGGAFNTPQLLKLSGIGPEEELSQHGIDVRVALPGVGENLQDRYEVGVVLETENNFSLLEGATFRGPEPGEAPDPHFVEWQGGEGVYTTNGAILSIIKRSESAIQSTKGPQLDPDLFIFGVAGFFKGYFPEYSKSIVESKTTLRGRFSRHIPTILPAESHCDPMIRSKCRKLTFTTLMKATTHRALT